MMEMIKTTISDKYLHSSELDLEYVKKALHERQLSGTSGMVERYEEALTKYFGSQFALAVSSGSTAIQAALVGLGVAPGDEVLVPAIAPLPTLYPISANGITPIPVDVRDNCLDFDPSDLEKKISSRTKAAILVPLWGYPFSMDSTLSLLHQYKIPLVEDASHAHGTQLNGKSIGTFGKVGCFSTHDRKILSTGEGGFILTDDKDLFVRMKSHTRLGNLTGDEPGVNFKSNALASALGLARLPDIEKQVAKRTKNALMILDRIRGDDRYQELYYDKAARPNYYNLVLKLTSTSDSPRQKLTALTSAGLIIDQIKYGYDVFYRRNAYSGLDTRCPNAESLVDHLIQIPVHPNLQDSDLSRIFDILDSCHI